MSVQIQMKVSLNSIAYLLSRSFPYPARYRTAKQTSLSVACPHIHSIFLLAEKSSRKGNISSFTLCSGGGLTEPEGRHRFLLGLDVLKMGLFLFNCCSVCCKSLLPWVVKRRGVTCVCCSSKTLMRGSCNVLEL